MGELYREKAIIGSGGTASALRRETLTSVLVGNKLHLKK